MGGVLFPAWSPQIMAGDGGRGFLAFWDAPYLMDGGFWLMVIIKASLLHGFGIYPLRVSLMPYFSQHVWPPQDYNGLCWGASVAFLVCLCLMIEAPADGWTVGQFGVTACLFTLH